VKAMQRGRDGGELGTRDKGGSLWWSEVEGSRGGRTRTGGRAQGGGVGALSGEEGLEG